MTQTTGNDSQGRLTLEKILVPAGVLCSYTCPARLIRFLFSVFLVSVIFKQV
jgi:hypothetical protein